MRVDIDGFLGVANDLYKYMECEREVLDKCTDFIYKVHKELTSARKAIEIGRGVSEQRSDAPYAAGALYYPEFYAAIQEYDEAIKDV